MAKVLKEQQGKVLIYNNKAFKYPEELQSVIDSIIGGSSGTAFDVTSSATSIPHYKFEDCKIVNGNFPNATSIGKESFSYCSSLKSINIPNVTTISDAAFYNYNELTSIDLPNVTKIGRNAFKGNSNLKSVKMPKLTFLTTYAFEGCSSLILIDFRGATAVPTLDSPDAFYSTPSNKKIVVPDALYDEWITGTNWSDTRNDIVTSIIKASDYEASL